MEGKAVNVVEFSAKGLSLFNGKLTIEASFKISSKAVKKLHYFSGYFLLFFFFNSTDKHS